MLRRFFNNNDAIMDQYKKNIERFTTQFNEAKDNSVKCAAAQSVAQNINMRMETRRRVDNFCDTFDTRSKVAFRTAANIDANGISMLDLTGTTLEPGYLSRCRNFRENTPYSSYANESRQHQQMRRYFRESCGSKDRGLASGYGGWY